jgi:E3 Ubiquitin ligase
MPPSELLHKVFGWPGVAVLCGVIPLVCSALLIKIAVKNWKVRWVAQAPYMVVSTLQTSLQPVRLRGRIAGIVQPLSDYDPSGHAVLGVRVEDLDEKNGWETRLNRIQTTPFWLDDGTGLIVVDPDRLDREFLGEGITASQHQTEEVLNILGCSPGNVQGLNLRFRIWELCKDERVTVVGTVFERDEKKYIAKADDRPLVVTTMDETNLGIQSFRQAKLALIWAAILGVPGLTVLLLAGREIMITVRRLFSGI